MPPTEGNLEDPRPPFAIEGGWREGRRRVRPAGARKAALTTAAIGLGLAAIPAAMAVARRRQHRSVLASMFG